MTRSIREGCQAPTVEAEEKGLKISLGLCFRDSLRDIGSECYTTLVDRSFKAL